MYWNIILSLERTASAFREVILHTESGRKSGIFYAKRARRHSDTHCDRRPQADFLRVSFILLLCARLQKVCDVIIACTALAALPSRNIMRNFEGAHDLFGRICANTMLPLGLFDIKCVRYIALKFVRPQMSTFRCWKIGESQEYITVYNTCSIYLGIGWFFKNN